MTDNPELIGTAEAAALLGKDRATVTRWAKSGRLEVFTQTPGIRGVYLFRRAVVVDLAAGMQQAS